jgi:hypothetical protein
MSSITITEEKLKNLFKETLKEVLTLEFMKLRADLLPFVSEKEQKEIEKTYGKPTRKVSKSVKFKI